MKKYRNLLFMFLVLLIPSNLCSQVPQGMSYQAVIRDSNELLVRNSLIGTEVSILQGDSDGLVVYKETHVVNSNKNGLINFVIGSGNSMQTFDIIDWSTGSYFVKIATDPLGGTNYTIVSTSQLLSVPYAFYSAKSGDSETINEYSGLHIKSMDHVDTSLEGTFVQHNLGVDGISKITNNSGLGSGGFEFFKNDGNTHKQLLKIQPDGHVSINNQYLLPNSKGNNGQVLALTSDDGNVGWIDNPINQIKLGAHIDHSSGSDRGEQGTHIQWNVDGLGYTSIINNKGIGHGGISFGESDTDGNITERMKIQPDGHVSINNQYSLPNSKGNNGQVLALTSDDGNVGWVDNPINQIKLGAHIDHSSGSDRGEQGTHIQWNVDGTGYTSITNNKGLGHGGISFGESDTDGNITERMKIQPDGHIAINNQYSLPNSKGISGQLLSVVNNEGGVEWKDASNTTINGIIIRNHTVSSVTDEGSYIKHSAGSFGSSDFYNNRGSGPGGFKFFNVHSADNISQDFTIKSDGNVGIGRTDPNKKLHVQNNTTDHVALIENTNSGGSGLQILINNDNTDENNNFLTFTNGTGKVTGRVEGFQFNPNFDPQPRDDNGNLILDNEINWFFRLAINQFSVNDINNPKLAFVSLFNKYKDHLANNATENFKVFFDTELTAHHGFNNQFPTSIGQQSLANINFGDMAIPNGLNGFSTFPTSFSSLFNVFKWQNVNDLFKQLKIPEISLPGLYPKYVNTILDPQGMPFAEINKYWELYKWAYKNGYEDLVPADDPVELAIGALKIAANDLLNNGGVTYGSKGADYAEWIPKEDVNEHFNIGEIVAVKDGKLTKNTEEAENIMIVSSRPIVLGNTPELGKEDHYAKVGFMGQVAALVKGKVNVGDYIIPSGDNDGFAIAIAPENVNAADIPKIAGKAWSASKNKIYDFINVAVGLKTSEMAFLMKKQEQKTKLLEDRMAALEKENISLSSEINNTVSTQDLEILLNRIIVLEKKLTLVNEIKD